MAPEDVASAGKLRKARSCIEFAATLQSKLSGALDARTIHLLLADSSHHIQMVHSATQSSLAGSLPPTVAKEVELHGRDLWNLCVNLRTRQDESTCTEKDKLLVKARALAYFMLELGRSVGRGKKDAESETVYLMNLALALGKLAIKGSDLDSARLALQKAAELVEKLKALPHTSSDPGRLNQRTRLDAEYLAMRTALSWKEDRLDVAEHMFRKIDDLGPTLDSGSAEIIADTLMHIGLDLASKGDNPMAEKWLRRAYEVISHQALDRLSPLGLELRLAICQGLISAFLAIGSQERVQEATNLIEYIESEIGDKALVLHWRLELLQNAPGEVFDIEAYASILHRMVRAFDCSDVSFHFLLEHVNKLKEKSPRLARSLLDELLLQHVIPSKKAEWIGKSILRRIWMGTADEVDPIAASADLQHLLDKAYDCLAQPVESDVAGAAQAAIWNKMDSLLGGNLYGPAEAWCLIALHKAFTSSGEANLGRFSRKLIICALGVKDAEKARQVFHSMSENGRNHIHTRYLMFQVSLIDWDHELGSESIKHLSKLSDSSQGRDILYACIKEAQQAGDRLCTLAALQAISESCKVDEATPSNLTSILRCSIRLMHLIEEEAGSAREAHSQSTAQAEDLCRLFEKAAQHASKDPRDEEGNVLFTISELNWFRRNSYNIGVSKNHTWDLSHLVRIFKVCLAFLHCYPKDLPVSEVAEMALIAMRCHFSIASALISLARTEDRVEEQLQHYLEMRRHVLEFDGVLESNSIGIDNENTLIDLVAKLSTLFVWDFEAAAALQSWDSLNKIVQRAKTCQDEATYKAMGDCMLRSRAPVRVMSSTMRLIINEIFELEQFDYGKLAKYILCMYKAIVGSDDDASALQLVDQALQLAREAKEAGQQMPSAELEWLAATTFNHAVEYYIRGEEEPCHRWALKAMDLAEDIGDGGTLRDLMQTKFAKRHFGGPRRDAVAS